MTSPKIEIRVYDSPLKMQADLADWLEERSAVTNLLLGLLYRIARREADGGEVNATLVAVFQDEEPKLAFLHLPPRTEMVMVSADEGWEDALEAAIVHFQNAGHDLIGLVAPDPQGELFARAYTSIYKVVFRQKVMRLDRIVPPRPASGEMRLAMPPDADVIATWVIAFFKEAMGKEISVQEAIQLARGKILDRSLYVWDHMGVKCMAGVERATRDGITVVLVYTPAEARSRGYASNLVAEMSAMQLRNGRKFVCLHTDADFPTSNKIYSDMGYYEVGEGRILHFGE